MHAGKENGGRWYLLLGSVSGTSPGTPLPGGMAVLPLNFDILSSIILSNLNGLIFHQFLGTLSVTNGGAWAGFHPPPIPEAAGLTIDFAYLLNNPFNFVSNPVTMEFVP